MDFYFCHGVFQTLSSASNCLRCCLGAPNTCVSKQIYVNILIHGAFSRCLFEKLQRQNGGTDSFVEICLFFLIVFFQFRLYI